MSIPNDGIAVQGNQNLDYRTTDTGNAERLIAEHGSDFRYCDALGGWLVWTGLHWKVDNAAIRQRARDVGRQLLHDAADEQNNQTRNRLIQHARYTLSNRGIANTVSVATTFEAVRVNPETFDSNPYLLNCLNGTVDMRTGKLQPHDREDLITKLAPVPFDPQADDSEWIAFLERVIPDEDVRDFLRISVGYSAIGNSAEHVMFILHGLGANGKSTFTETLKTVLGDYAHRTNTNALVNGGAGYNGPTPDLANLKGRRFTYASESEEGQRLDEPTVKSITGGGTINARHMYSTPFEFEPTHTLWLETNHKPMVRGTDPAIWRRLKLIPFEVSIPKAEQDRRLPEKLKEQAPGVLNWIVRGAWEWHHSEDGLTDPSAVSDATEAYRYDMDRIGQFVEVACEVGEGYTVPLGELYLRYSNWVTADENTEKPEGKKLFGLRMEGKGYKKVKTGGRNRSWAWSGIRLRTGY